MNSKFIALSALVSGLAFSSHAQLVFSNLTAAVGSAPTNLLGVTIGGALGNTVVAVGDNARTYARTLNADFSGGALSAPGTWSSTSVSSLAPSNGYSLKTVTYGNGMFAAAGSNNVVFTSTDNGGSWSFASKVFANGVEVPGLASDGSSFVAAPASPQISWATGALASWTIGSNATPYVYAFLESFRSVTAFGAGNFAAVGAQGIVRRSTDGGRTWHGIIGVTNTFSRPNLLGVASDNASTLVAVGNNGTILTSLDAGLTWATNTPALLANRVLHAVSYLNPGFVAVGSDQGTNSLVLTSPDGVSWTTNSSLAINRNLRGVAFGRGGTLQGVGLAVGENGAVLLGGVLPAPPANPQSKTNCADTPPNPALVVEIIPGAYHPAGSVAVDWFDAPIGGNLVTNDSTSFYPTNTSAANDNSPGIYRFYAQSRDRRTGFTSSNRTEVIFQVNPRPKAHVTGNATICNGDSTIVQAALSGTAPWTVTWSSNGVVVAVISNVLSNNHSYTVTPVNPNLNNAITTVYTVTALSDGNTCDAFPSNFTGSASITINPRPTATLLDTNTICNGQTTAIRALLTGIGPWTVRWSDGVVQVTNAAVGNPVTLVRQLSSLEVTNVLPNLPTTHFFSVTSVSNATGCTANQPGDIQGTNSVTVNPRPTATLSDNLTICNGQTATIHALLTGLGPWTVRWSDGTIQTTNAALGSSVTLVRNLTTAEVTNTLANLATNHFFAVTSVSNATSCVANQPGDITGTNVVTVNPRPTATLNDNLAICNGQPVTIQAQLTGLGPWTVRWSDGFEQTTNAPLGSAVTLQRGFTSTEVTNVFANVATNYSYWVLSVSNATTCVANQPGDIQGTNSVTVNPRPTATLSDNLTICNGQTATVHALLTGLGPWTVRWSDGTIQTTNAALGSSVTLVRNLTTAEVTNTLANLPTNHFFAVTSVSNATSCVANQPGDLTGTNLVTVYPLPTATISGTTNIAVAGTNAVTSLISAELTGLGPWVVQWNDGSSNFVAGPGPTTLTREVTNQLAYLTQTNIVCTSYAGNSGNCKTFATNVTTTLVGGSVTYYVTNLVDNGNPGTCGANLAQLTNIANRATVTLSPGLFAQITPINGPDICSGGFGLLQVDLTGFAPWTVLWSDGVTNIVTNSYVREVAADVVATTTNLYWITSLVDGSGSNAAPANLGGTNTFVFIPLPANSLLPATVTNCVGITNPPLTVVPGGGNTVNWYDAATNLLATATNSFTPTNQTVGTHTFYVSEVNAGGCESTNLVRVDLVIQPCTNAINSISLQNSNAIIEWYGNYVLQHATNLVPPVTWYTLTQGLPGMLNSWTNSTTPPPDENYFRLYAPTNSP